MNTGSLRVIDITDIARACRRYSLGNWLVAFFAGCAAIAAGFFRMFEEGSFASVVQTTIWLWLALMLAPAVTATWVISLPRHFHQGMPLLLGMLAFNSLVLIIVNAVDTNDFVRAYLPIHLGCSVVAAALSLHGMKLLAATRSAPPGSGVSTFWQLWSRAFQAMHLSLAARMMMALRAWRPKVTRLLSRMGVFGLLGLYAALAAYISMRFEPTDLVTLLSVTGLFITCSVLLGRFLSWLLSLGSGLTACRRVWP